MALPVHKLVHEELLAAPAHYRQLLDAATPERLRRCTDGTRWTNQEMLFHLLLTGLGRGGRARVTAGA